MPAGGSPYDLLHRLPIFQDGFDLFTGNRQAPVQWTPYTDADFPVTDKMLAGLVFLPLLSDPAPGAVEKVLDAIRKVATAATLAK